MFNLLAIIATLIIVTAAITGYIIGAERAEIRHLRERLNLLDEAQQKRMNYHTLNELMDAMAVLNNEYFKDSVKKDFMDNLKAHLNEAMEGNKKAGRNG
jgi:hypothetical protein